jgi:lipopolysaccharide transport protein LptA
MKTRSIALLIAAALSGPALAQNVERQSSNFALSNDQPIQIESDQLEVSEANGRADFTGNVNVVQGEMVLKSGAMTVFYSGDSGSVSTGTAAIERIELSDKVFLQSGEQTASADAGTYDMTSEVLTLSGERGGAVGGRQCSCRLPADRAGRQRQRPARELRQSRADPAQSELASRRRPVAPEFRSLLSLGRKAAAQPVARKDVDGSSARYEGTLIARGLTKSYKSRAVVDGVSLGVRRGEAVGLLGPNGAGKTTCFYMITGLVPVDRGTIEIDGFDVTAMPMYRRARLGVGYLPQEASIFRGLSVEDNIRAVLESSSRIAGSGRPSSTSCWPNSRSRICASRRRSRCPAVSAGASKLPAHWPPTRPSCCSTNPSPASIRSLSPTSRTSSGT